MKPISLLLALFLSINCWALGQDNSSRTLYILSDTPVSHLDFGLYRMDLALETELRPELARFMNILPDRIRMRTYITVGQETSMILVIETTIDETADRERSELQAENICDLVQSAQLGFLRANRLKTFFASKDPFTDKRPDGFAEDLESLVQLKVRVPRGGMLPFVECMQPLRNSTNGK